MNKSIDNNNGPKKNYLFNIHVYRFIDVLIFVVCIENAYI